jgi:hypothetical protein
MNEKNFNFYFSLTTNNKNLIKNLKEKNKTLQTKYNPKIKEKFLTNFKKIKNIINKEKSSTETTTNTDLYTNTNINSNIILTENSNEYKDTFIELNSMLQTVSIIKTDLFHRLYIKFIYNNSNIKKFNQDDMVDMFSFWYILKMLKNLQIENINQDINGYKYIEKIMIKQNKTSKNKFFKKLVIIPLRKYLYTLFDNKNIEEKEIFEKDYFYFYEYLFKLNKLNLIKNAFGVLSEGINVKNREDLIFLKEAYMAIFNNGNYSFQITNK